MKFHLQIDVPGFLAQCSCRVISPVAAVSRIAFLHPMPLACRRSSQAAHTVATLALSARSSGFIEWRRQRSPSTAPSTSCSSESGMSAYRDSHLGLVNRLTPHPAPALSLILPFVFSPLRPSLQGESHSGRQELNIRFLECACIQVRRVPRPALLQHQGGETHLFWAGLHTRCIRCRTAARPRVCVLCRGDAGRRGLGIRFFPSGQPQRGRRVRLSRQCAHARAAHPRG